MCCEINYIESVREEGGWNLYLEGVCIGLCICKGSLET